MQKPKFIILLLLLISCLISCNESRTTNTYSKDFESKTEKLNFLKKYLNLRTEVEDLEYHISYMDNSTGMLPGPSEWTIRVALKVNTDSLSKWNLNCRQGIETKELGNWADIFTEDKEWNLEWPKVACNDGYILVVKNDIVLFFDTTHPTIKQD